jgi:ABC-type lipoprotein export system ATPase subunit
MSLLEARDISFRYSRASPPLLRSFELSVEPGEMVAVRGPSGAGKSTLLYLLGLMLRPTSGEIRIAGRRVDDLPDRGRAAVRATELGFVFQDAALDPTRTVLDNVLETAVYRGEPRQWRIERATWLLERFGVSARAGGRPGQISGGQAQRIALCRALLGEPRVVLADEPTGNLDSASASVVVEALRDHARAGGAVVLVTHSQQVGTDCDRQVDL